MDIQLYYPFYCTSSVETARGLFHHIFIHKNISPDDDLNMKLVENTWKKRRIATKKYFFLT